MGGRIFPADYYKVCTSNKARGGRWLCNKALSPALQDNENVQDETITSSDQSANSSKNVSTEPALHPEESMSASSSSVVSDSDIDPDYLPDNSEESSSESCKSALSVEISTIEDFVCTNPEVLSNPTEESGNASADVTHDGTNADLFYGKRQRHKDFCYYCEEWVQSFGRHVVRNHSTETDVQKILSYPLKSKSRKHLLATLRKKGNFLSSSEVQKPVKKSHLKENLLPCTECLGFYSAKQLWRHKKTCTENPSTGKIQANAQNFLLKQLKRDTDLMNKVFPRMRPDNISLVAKKDWLICAYGARYLKIHREAHYINVVSRKMRELARLLIEIKQLKNDIKTLLDILKPENYDIIVQATKNVAKYDNEKEFYQSPTFAMNIGTSIKQCCDIAVMHTLKKKNYGNISTAEITAELKTIIELISAHWKFDVSSHAGNDLNSNKWNKVTLIPLASDIKLLKDYLIRKGNEAASALQANPHVETYYKNLLETIYCRIILLNRKRPGELQRLSLHTYETSLTDTDNQNYEEFSEAVTPTERILMKKFKRLVIRGKRGRGVPVLFSNDVQDNIGVLLKHRGNLMRKPNLYLFGNVNSSEPICGYKTLQKYAKICGAKNPKAITSTKLRKHLATLSQIFNMTEGDLEQLSTFMGHTLGVHRQSYRLPDDVYQTEKISKILLLMEKGSLSQFKGKSLDEINVNLEEDLLDDKNEDIGENENIGENEDKEEDNNLDDKIEDTNMAKQVVSIETTSAKEQEKVTGKKQKRVLVKWTEEQKQLVVNFFTKHIKAKKPPKRHECEQLLENHPKLLHNKDWLKIKVFVQNKYTGKLRS